MWRWVSQQVAAIVPLTRCHVASSGLPSWQTVFPQHENRDYLGVRPETRYGHTATVIGEEIFVALGYFYDHWDGGGPTWHPDVWALSGMQGDALPTWRLVFKDVELAAPAPRMSHVAVAPPGDRTLVVFGGADSQHQMLNDVWELDVISASWTLHVPVSQLPPPRNCFSAVILDGSMVIYGGFHLGDIWRYHFSERKWEMLQDTPKRDSPDHPGRRSSHASVAAPNGVEMYVYGGFRFPDDVSDPERFAYGKLQDLWSYSIAENRWRLLPQVNSQGGREYYAMERVPWWKAGDDYGDPGLAVFGGVQCHPSCSLVGSLSFFNLRQNRWLLVNVTAQPLARYQHTLVLHKGALWIFGGESYEPHMYHNSVERFPLEQPDTTSRDTAEL